MAAKEKQYDGLFWALLVIVLTAPTQWGHTLGSADHPLVTICPADVLIGLAFLFWAGLALTRRAELGLPPACLWSLVGIALISSLNAARAIVTEKSFTYLTPGFTITGSTVGSVVKVMQLGEYMLAVYILVWAALRNARQLRAVAWALVAATTGVVLLGLAHYVTRRAPEESFYVRGDFMSRYIYSGYLAMALPVIFALALSAADKRVRFGLLALVVVGAVTILSPGALIALAVVLPLVASRISPRALQATMAGVLAFGVLTAVALPRNYKENVYNFLRLRYEDDQMNEVLKAQYLEWVAGTYLVREVPLLGVGYGNFQSNIGTIYGTVMNIEKPRKSMPGPDAYAGKKMEPDQNNLYVVMAAQVGLLGLAALLWCLVYFGKTAAAAARRAADDQVKAVALGVWGGIIAFAITSVWSSLLVRGTGVVLALFFAIAMVLRCRDWAAQSEADGPGLRVMQ